MTRHRTCPKSPGSNAPHFENEMPPQGQTETVAGGVPVPFIGDGVLPPIPDPSPPRQATANEPGDAEMATMNPHQLKHYLTTLIAREWKKSAACLYPARNNVITDLVLSDKELAVCHVKFRCEDVPAHVVAKVQHLFDLSEQARIRGGQDWAVHDCSDSDKFMALLRNELRMVTFEDDVNSPKIDKYKGVSGAVAMVSNIIYFFPRLLHHFPVPSRRLMMPLSFQPFLPVLTIIFSTSSRLTFPLLYSQLAELARFQVQMDIDYALDIDISHKISFKAAIVCGRGHTYTYAFSALLDAKFAVVMRELDRRFPRLCNPRCQNMVGRWLAHVEDLKQTGMDGHPRLALVERLIQEHTDAPHEMFEDWMYVHELSSRGDRLKGEEEFKALMQWAAASAGHQPRGCLMRVSASSQII